MILFPIRKSKKSAKSRYSVHHFSHLPVSRQNMAKQGHLPTLWEGESTFNGVAEGLLFEIHSGWQWLSGCVYKANPLATRLGDVHL